MGEDCAISATFRPSIVSATFIREHHVVLSHGLNNFTCFCTTPIAHELPELHPLRQSPLFYIRDAESQPNLVYQPSRLVVKPEHRTAKVRAHGYTETVG